MVSGFVPIFPFDDAHDFTVMDRGIQLLEVENVICDWLWVRVRVAFVDLSTLVNKSEHPTCDKAFGFFIQSRARDFGFAAALGNGLSVEDNRANCFILVLNGVNEVKL